MRATNVSTAAGPPRVRQAALWFAFTALLVAGLILYFRLAGRVVPLMDVVGDR